MTATMQPKLAMILTSSCHHQNDEHRLLCGAGRSRDIYCTMSLDSASFPSVVETEKPSRILDEIPPTI